MPRLGRDRNEPWYQNNITASKVLAAGAVQRYRMRKLKETGSEAAVQEIRAVPTLSATVCDRETNKRAKRIVFHNMTPGSPGSNKTHKKRATQRIQLAPPQTVSSEA